MTVPDTWFRLVAVMITTSKQTTLKQSDDFKSVSFGIKESGLSHIFNVLRNQLYSDKVLAVIREYSTNAVDAHIEAGKADTPIKVTLPSQLTPEFKVRDFGRGLTEQQVSEIYAMYGESTKRGTNEQIGQLGLGSKSAFAYGDNFIINSYVKGTKTTYNAFIDPSDVGQISKIHKENTEENDGIEIVVPVKTDDFDEFYKKAVKLYKYFKVIPDVKGVSKTDLDYDLKEGKITAKGDNWKMIQGESYAVMGNIAYPLDHSALNLGWQDKRTELINAGVVINFNIGDLEISASREALQYTGRTKSSIIAKLDKIIEDLPEILSKEFANCKTLWEAKCLYNEAFSYGGFGYTINKLMQAKGVFWNGVKITNNQFINHEWGRKVEIRSYSKDRYSKRKKVKAVDVNHILAKKHTLVIYDNVSTYEGRMNRIAPLLEEYEGRDKNHKDTPIYEQVFLVRFNDSKAEQEFFDDQKLDFDAKNLSEYPKVILRDIYPSNSTVSGGISSVKNSKHNTKVFSVNEKCDKSRYHTCRSDFFNSDAVNLNDGGVYVVVNKFNWGKARQEQSHPADLVESIRLLRSAGIEDMPTVYAFKPTDKNIKAIESDKWKYFGDWAKEKLQEYLSQNNLTADLFWKVLARKHRKSAHRLSPQEKDQPDGIGLCKSLIEVQENNSGFVNELPSGSLAKKYLTRYYDMFLKENVKLDQLLKAFDSIGEKSTDLTDWDLKPDTKKVLDFCWGKEWDYLHMPENDLNTMNKECIKRYPMLQFIDQCYFSWNRQEDAFKATVEYITIVEATYNIKKKINKTAEQAQEVDLKLKQYNSKSQTVTA